MPGGFAGAARCGLWLPGRRGSGLPVCGGGRRRPAALIVAGGGWRALMRAAGGEGLAVSRAAAGGGRPGPPRVCCGDDGRLNCGLAIPNDGARAARASMTCGRSAGRAAGIAAGPPGGWTISAKPCSARPLFPGVVVFGCHGARVRSAVLGRSRPPERRDGRAGSQCPCGRTAPGFRTPAGEDRPPGVVEPRLCRAGRCGCQGCLRCQALPVPGAAVGRCSSARSDGVRSNSAGRCAAWPWLAIRTAKRLALLQCPATALPERQVSPAVVGCPGATPGLRR